MPYQDWVTVSCWAGREKTTMGWMARAGAELYFPRTIVRVRRSKGLSHSQRRHGATAEVEKSLFPGYFFGRNVVSQLGRYSVPGLKCVLVSRSVERAVEALRATQVSEEIIRVEPHMVERPVGIGDLVRITDGPFTGFGGFVTELIGSGIDDGTRIIVDVDIFGRATPVELGFDQVEVVARATPVAAHGQKSNGAALFA